MKLSNTLRSLGRGIKLVARLAKAKLEQTAESSPANRAERAKPMEPARPTEPTLPVERS